MLALRAGVAVAPRGATSAAGAGLRAARALGRGAIAAARIAVTRGDALLAVAGFGFLVGTAYRVDATVGVGATGVALLLLSSEAFWRVWRPTPRQDIPSTTRQAIPTHSRRSSRDEERQWPRERED